MYLLLTVCAFFSGLISLAVLWICGSPDGSSWTSAAYRFFFVKSPKVALDVLTRVCGPGAARGVRALGHYIFKTNNPIVQVIYLLIMCGGYSQVVLVGYPWIPNAYIGVHHKYIAFGVFVVCLATFLYCSLRDPGVITNHNVKEHLRLYGYDKCIYFPQTPCATCKFNKPARSKHCRLCNVCVARFDHHCVWIGNCVGARNHGAFIIFLLTHFLMCAYGSVTIAGLLLGIIEAKRLTSAMFIDPVTGRRAFASWGLIMQYMAGNFGSLIFLGVLFIVFFFLLLGFTGYHIYTAVLRNSTTNESFKYRCMRQVLSSPFPMDNEDDGAALSNKGSASSTGSDRQPLVDKDSSADGAEAVSAGLKPTACHQDSGESPALQEESSGAAEASGKTVTHGKPSEGTVLHPPLMTAPQAREHVKKARAQYNHGLVDNLVEVFWFDDWMRETLKKQEADFKRAQADAAAVAQAVAAASGEGQPTDPKTRRREAASHAKEL